MGTIQSRLWTVCVPVSFHFVAFLCLWNKQRNQRNLEPLAVKKIGYVSGIFIYPVKSCKGISLDSSNCLLEGLEFDRFVESKICCKMLVRFRHSLKHLL